MGMTGFPPGEFSLTSPGIKNPGQVRFRCLRKGAEHMNTGPQSKNRRYPRIALLKGMHVSWQVKSERAVSPVTTLGLGGLFVSTPKPPAVGEVVRLVLRLPDGEVCAKGVIRDSQPGRGMGVEFTEMGQSDRARLQQLLKRLLQ
jgi:Tfp pilus assembly protein PilZ